MKPSALLLALIAAGVAAPGSARASEDFCSRLVIYAVQQVCQLLGNGLTQCQPVGVAGPAPGCAQPGAPAYWPVVMGPPVLQMPPALPHAPLLPNPYLAWNVRPYGMAPAMAMPPVPPMPPVAMVQPAMPVRDPAPAASVPAQTVGRDAATTVGAGPVLASAGITPAGEHPAVPTMSEVDAARPAMREAMLDNLTEVGQPQDGSTQEAAARHVPLPVGDEAAMRPSPAALPTARGDEPTTPAGDAQADPSGQVREAVTAEHASPPSPVAEAVTTPAAVTPVAVAEHGQPGHPDRPAPVSAMPAVVAREHAVIDEAKAHFAFDSAELTDAGRAAIDAWLRQVPAGMRVRLTGHADRLGPAPYNLELSRRRAEAVRDYLVQRGYVAADIQVLAKGESEPVKHCAGGATPVTKACLAPNRRVEVVAH